MTLRLLSCVLLGLVFSLTGCRDALVDPEASIEPPPATAELPTPYFKGPGAMPIGSSRHFRVEAVEGAAEYRWFFDSDESGQLSGTISEDAGGLNRFLNATATSFGSVNIVVSVFDANGTLIAGTSKRVAITVQ